MNPLPDFVTIEQLEPSKTYAVRTAMWQPAAFTRHEDGRVGTLTIELSRSLKSGTKVECDVYAVEMGEPIGVMGHVFLLLNLSDPDQPDVYSTTIARPASLCTCKAGSCKLVCKHVDALSRLVEVAREPMGV